MEPHYDQKFFSEDEKHNKLCTVVSPIGSKDGGVQVHQNTWFSMGKLDKNTEMTYTLKDQANGVYAFIIDGNASINETQLSRRDGLAITETKEIRIKAETDAEILLMEIPLL